jgi:hypothetical protein
MTPDRELFSLLSDFYLNPVQLLVKEREDELNHNDGLAVA